MLGCTVREAASTEYPLLPQLEKTLVQQQRLSTTKNKYINNFLKFRKAFRKPWKNKGKGVFLWSEDIMLWTMALPYPSCDTLKQVAEPLWISVSPSVKWGQFLPRRVSMQSWVAIPWAPTACLALSWRLGTQQQWNDHRALVQRSRRELRRRLHN